MKLTLRLFFLLTTVFSGVCLAEDSPEGDRLFTLYVQPLLSEKCNGCHGDDAEKVKGKFNMLTRESLLAGGETFGVDVLVPGDTKKSFLIESIKWSDPDFEMPPKENDRLSSEQIGMVEEWINAGAPWPSEEKQLAIRQSEAKRKVTAEGIIVETSGGLGDDWTYRRYQPEDIWAFLPVRKPSVPKSTSPNPIDAFLNTKLADATMTPAPEADTRTLIRRATYDLIGLPPTPDEVAAFQKDWASNKESAWSTLLDRLLASPRYGERWGQHWLDVARYADTGGMSNDYERSNAWRYRDYVIRAFNDDKPYDRFVIEQLAGDELADASVTKRQGGGEAGVQAARLAGNYNEQEAEWLLATGFLRMGAWDNAMVKDEEARQLYLDDVVNSVGQTFLSTTMRCFKCHDHKFDPLPTRDYYRMYATFAGTQMAERPVPFLEEENQVNFAEGKAHVERMLAFAVAEKNALVKKRESAAKAWFTEHNLPYLNEEDRKDLDDDKKPPRHVGLDITEQGQLKVREQDEWIWTRRLERYEPMMQSVYNGSRKGSGNARKLRIPSQIVLKQAIESNILTGGSLEAPGESVTPGVLSMLGVPSPTANKKDPYAIPETVAGRRLGLAQWIADGRNPLTARSIVNRIWQQHFVHPIAGNPNNFGVKGQKPTHPELLDWLAADFVENGWTMKRLHRLIMTSEAYRRSGQHPEYSAVASEDPNNHLLSYFPARRLTAEELRDSLLTVTGELNSISGGLPANPEINMEVALQPRMIQFSLAPAYQPDPTPDQRNRRTIYAYRVRGLADPFLELFNQPNPNDSCEGRESAAVSPQAFTLLNSDTMTDRSIAFATRLEKEGRKEAKGKIQRAFHLAFGRNPDAVEIERLENYVKEMTAYHASAKPQVVSYPEKITRSLVEEFSGETFEYEEILPAFENYQADMKPADISVETRALADLCLLLFNSNEFVYVY